MADIPIMTPVEDETAAALAEIRRMVADIQAKVDGMDALLRQRLDTISSSCEHMDGHISFVEDVYNTVRAPLSYLSSKFGTCGELPAPMPVEMDMESSRLDEMD